MSKGLLSEQMGAMALVDELRHRRMEIEEHLDLPRREAEVAERIRSYYKSQGIACDDLLVAQGVREFFTHRLVFEAPPMNWRERFLGRLISSTAFRFWVMFMLAFAVMFGMSFGASFFHGFKKGFSQAIAPAAQVSLEAPAATNGSTKEQAVARFQELRDRYVALPLSDADRERAQSGFDYFANAAAVGGSYADERLDELQVQLDFVAPALTYSLTTLADGKTGVEVCKQDDGCQKITRFVFIRATDSEDRPVSFTQKIDSRITAMPVKGIEVSQADYLKFKQELRDTDRIANPVVGNKPAATHREIYDSRFSSIPVTLNPDKLATLTVLDSF